MRAVVWSGAARADLLGIISYYAERDPRIGFLLVDRIEAAAAKLTAFDTGRPGRVPGTREKSVHKTNQILVYEIHPDRVEILRVVHTAQDWPEGQWPSD